MLPLPNPAIRSVRHGLLGAFRNLINPATGKDWHRILIWILSAWREASSCPILAVEGPASSGKLTAAHFLRQLMDPANTPYADAFASRQGLVAYARRNWLVIFDNIGRLTPLQAWFANGLSEGLAIHAKRPRRDPISLELQRPVVLTLQPPPPKATRSSVALKPNRTLRVSLARLTPDRNRALDRLWSEFNQLRPELLEFILALSTGLRNLPGIRAARIPGTDVSHWALAAAPALGLSAEQVHSALKPDNGPTPAPSGADLIDSLLSFPGGNSWTA